MMSLRKHIHRLHGDNFVFRIHQLQISCLCRRVATNIYYTFGLCPKNSVYNVFVHAGAWRVGYDNIWITFLRNKLLGKHLASVSSKKLRVSPAGSAPADPLTGQELQYPGERVAAVVIDNAPASTPQWGISSASVVLEALTINDRPTSLCLAYPSVSAMPTVGPVTLGQDLYWRLLSGQEVLPIQRGAGQFTRNYLDYYNLRAVDALEVGRNAFSCDDVWSGAPLWHTSGEEITSVLGRLNLSGALGDHGSSASSSASTAEDSSAISALPALLPQAKEPRLPEPGSRDAEQVLINFAPQSTTGFAYDAASGSYGMLRADGTAQLDANTGMQARFDNLLVLYSASSLRDDGLTLDYDLSFGGGVWLNGGRLWHITWTQGTDSTFVFYDADGRPLSICAGRSYIAMVSSVTGQELTVLDSAGQNALN